MVHQYNIEDQLQNIYLVAFKYLSGNAGNTVSMIQQKKIQNFSHSLSSEAKTSPSKKQVRGPHDLGPGGQGGSVEPILSKN